MKKELLPADLEELINELRVRFAENMGRHRGIDWELVQSRLGSLPEKLWALSEMDRTGGAPDVIGSDDKTGEFIFCDCSAESPKGRRSLCYDRAAWETRKEHKPASSAIEMAEAMGISMLTEAEYADLQMLGEFDLKTSSWLTTPHAIRQHGGAIFGDRRFGRVFKGHVSLGSLRVRQDYLIAQAFTSPFKQDNKNIDPMMQMALARLRQLAAHEVGHTIGLNDNYISSTNARSSVMDYPHPIIEFTDSETDFRNAYDVGIGEWDKRAIIWGYQEFPIGNDENKSLDLILEQTNKMGLPYLSDQDARPLGSAHPANHLWDNGKDIVAVLNRLMQTRRKALNQFGVNSIRFGDPMSYPENVLVPLYLSHRYQIEAVSKIIGGVDYAYVLPDRRLHRRGGGDRDAAQLVAQQKQHGRRALVFGVGVGEAPNSALIAGLSRAGEGVARHVRGPDDVARAVAEFRRDIDSPVLTDVRVDWGPPAVTAVEPGTVPDLFASQPLVLHGRFRGAAPTSLQLHGVLDRRDVTIPIVVTAVGEREELLAGLWARSRVDSLELARTTMTDVRVVEQAGQQIRTASQTQTRSPLPSCRPCSMTRVWN